MASARQAADLVTSIAGRLGWMGSKVEETIAKFGLNAADLAKLSPDDAARLVHEARTAAMFGQPTTVYGAPVMNPPPKVEIQAPGLASLPLDERIVRDPQIRRAIEAAGGTVPTGSAEDILEAYRGTFARPRRGRPKAEDAIRELVKPADQAAAESIAGQFDAQAGRYGVPFNDDPKTLRAAHTAMREGWPIEYDAAAEDILDPAILGEMHPAQQDFLRELGNNEWLGFDYPSQAADAALSREAHNWEMSPALVDARNRLLAAHADNVIPPPQQTDVARTFDAIMGYDGTPTRTPNALIPYGHRGPGVTVGEPYGPDFGRLQFDPGWKAMVDEVGPRKLTGPSAPSGSGNGMARRAALAAAAAGAAGGAYMLSRGGSGSSGGDLTDPGNPADLKEDPVSGSPMAFSDETLGGMSPADLVTPVGPAKPSGASAYDPGVERLRRMAEYNAASRAGTLTPQQLAAGSDTRLLTDQINAATQSPDYRFPSNHPSADLRNRARQLPMNSPERDRLNAQAAAIDNEVLAGRRQWDFNPPSAAAADPWADTVGPSPSQSAAPPAAAPSPAAKGSPVAPKPAQYSNNFVDRMDGLTLHQEIQRVLQQVEDINTDPDPNRRWTQDEWDYAKELIAEHNARAHVGIRGYEPMHNPFLDSDRREADLTEAGNPAELAATPVAAPQMAGRAQAPAGPAAPGRNGIPLPQVVTSGRSAPTGPTTVPTMTLGLDKADAAATPITPDADLKPNAPPASPADLSRMLPGETMDEYKARVAQVMGAETQGIRDRTAARSNAGYKDAERQAIDAEYATPPLSPRDSAAGEWRSDNGGPPRLYGEGVPTWARGAFGAGQATIDGVTVPTYDLGDGQMRYRLGDVKAAQEAAAEARRVAGVRNIVNSENERYGHYSITSKDDPRLTDAQRAARAQRAAGEERAKDQRARIRQAQIDNANRPLTPFEKKDQERRQRYSDMARLAGGSQNINAGNRAFFNALATLEGVAPEQMDSRQRVMAQMMPMDPVRAQVEARQLDQAARLAGDAITGALAGQGQMDQAGALRREQRMQNLRAVAGQAYRSAYRSGRREAVDAALIGEGASLQERQAILADLFPGGQEPAPDDASEGQYFPGQTPAPPPGEPLAAPRPFG